MRTLLIRLPKSLHKAVRELAKKENISINQFVSLALAEKVAAIGAQDYLEKRAQRASETKFDAAMSKVAEIAPPEYAR